MFINIQQIITFLRVIKWKKLSVVSKVSMLNDNYHYHRIDWYDGMKIKRFMINFNICHVHIAYTKRLTNRAFRIPLVEKLLSFNLIVSRTAWVTVLKFRHCDTYVPNPVGTLYVAFCIFILYTKSLTNV